MISFATELPLKATTTTDHFFAAIREWILGSPHSMFRSEDLLEFGGANEWSQARSQERLEFLRPDPHSNSSAAIRYSSAQGGLEWVSTVVFWHAGSTAWIGIRVSCESNRPSARLPVAKKPFLVRTILNRLQPGLDGELQTSDKPILLANSEVPLAARCISGHTGSYLPIVYVSAQFRGGYAVNVDALAKTLSGMAHVVVEPNRPFSLRLMEEVKGENVFGGSAGIYWPSSGGRRSFFDRRFYSSSKDVERDIYEEVRKALVNRRPQPLGTWASIQEQVSRSTIAKLRQAGSTQLDEYIENFDKELGAKQQALEDAEREIARLGAEVRRFQATSPMQAGLSLITSPEQDLYAGEISDIVHDALEDAMSRVPEGSRRQHVLTRLVAANPRRGDGEAIRGKIKALLRDYRSMDAKVRGALQELGFEISEEGKHIKVCFQGDDRYTYILPKTGSDNRGGLNSANEICRKFF
ncbi:hypothetical protein EM868_06785 [Cupriavidus gilardii]|uniref:hypothetical protein n=1 Tax=Cupriavidus gilardii TaxID=82541 RepID=UPI001EE62040|nr:hypothetical protein [Cupriavidus gilardii]MCG5260097.1 hypothetical protein [Cupriavidus gilardii]MDF9429499.1 hypothetical protein [Cupriavidus gilardii]